MTDSEFEYELLAMFDIDDTSYAAIVIDEKDTNKLGNIIFYGCNENDNGELNLIEIQNEEEYKKVSKLFYEIIEEQNE